MKLTLTFNNDDMYNISRILKILADDMSIDMIPDGLDYDETSVEIEVEL